MRLGNSYAVLSLNSKYICIFYSILYNKSTGWYFVCANNYSEAEVPNDSFYCRNEFIIITTKEMFQRNSERVQVTRNTFM